MGIYPNCALNSKKLNGLSPQIKKGEKPGGRRMNLNLSGITKTCGKGFAWIAAILGGNELLKTTVVDATTSIIKDSSGTTRRDELICERILGTLKVPEDLKILLTTVRAEIEKDFREYVIRKNGTERQFYETRDAKEKKDGALMTIGQSEKDEKTGTYPDGEEAAYKLFEGVQILTTVTEKKERLRINLLTIGTDRRELSKSKQATKIVGDTSRRVNRFVKEEFPSFAETGKEVILDAAVWLDKQRHSEKVLLEEIRDIHWLGESGKNIFMPVKKIWAWLLN